MGARITKLLGDRKGSLPQQTSSTKLPDCALIDCTEDSKMQAIGHHTKGKKQLLQPPDFKLIDCTQLSQAQAAGRHREHLLCKAPLSPEEPHLIDCTQSSKAQAAGESSSLREQKGLDALVLEEGRTTPDDKSHEEEVETKNNDAVAEVHHPADLPATQEAIPNDISKSDGLGLSIPHMVEERHSPETDAIHQRETATAA